MNIMMLMRRCQQHWTSSGAKLFFLIATLIAVVNPMATVDAAHEIHTVSKACGTTIICDDFESQSGTLPSGAWQIDYPSCHGTGTAVVDHGVAHSGKTSIRINGHAGYCNHVFISLSKAFARASTNLYVRFFIRHSTLLPQGHVAFLAMKDSHDGNKDLRMGGQNSALQWNRESDDATLPVQSPAGVALSAVLPINQWQCIEFNINEAQGTLATWLNGNTVQGLHVGTKPTQDVDAQWLNRAWHPALTDLRLGWESYGGGDDTLWFDDVAIGSQRIGCKL